MNEKTSQIKTQLDWSAYESYGSFGFDSFGDFGGRAAAPAAGGGYAKAAAVCMGKRQ